MATPTGPILPVPPLAESGLIDALRSIATPLLSDNLGRGSGVVGLSRYARRGKLLGTALTVKTRGGDNLYIYKALTMARPGHVLVVDAGGDVNNAVVGDLLKLYALKRGVTGFVIDGAIRDVASFEDGLLPCYARAAVHRGPYKDGPGEINVPVSIGGQVINPGDIVVGDEDGLVSFPQASAAALLELARASAAKEELIRSEIETGSVDQSWILSVLKPKGLAD